MFIAGTVRSMTKVSPALQNTIRAMFVLIGSDPKSVQEWKKAKQFCSPAGCKCICLLLCFLLHMFVVCICLLLHMFVVAYVCGCMCFMLQMFVCSRCFMLQMFFVAAIRFLNCIHFLLLSTRQHFEKKNRGNITLVDLHDGTCQNGGGVDQRARTDRGTAQ
jgi:hypothetical protein